MYYSLVFGDKDDNILLAGQQAICPIAGDIVILGGKEYKVIKRIIRYFQEIIKDPIVFVHCEEYNVD